VPDKERDRRQDGATGERGERRGYNEEDEGGDDRIAPENKHNRVGMDSFFCFLLEE